MIPSATSTEFLSSIRAGRADAEAMTAGADFGTPEQVASAILELIRSGESRMDLRPGGLRRHTLTRDSNWPLWATLDHRGDCRGVNDRR